MLHSSDFGGNVDTSEPLLAGSIVHIIRDAGKAVRESCEYVSSSLDHSLLGTLNMER